MQIEVRLFTTLRAGRFNREKLDFPSASSVTDVCRRLEIDPGAVAILLVNGQAVAREHVLQPDDVVSLFPAVGGG